MTYRVLTAGHRQDRNGFGLVLCLGAGKVGLLVSTSALALLMSSPLLADDCSESVTYGDASCTLNAGTTEGVSIVQFGFQSGNTMTLVNNATLSQNTDTANHNENSNELFLDFFGLNGTTDDGVNGTQGPQISVTNNGDITTSGTSSQQDTVTEVAPIEIFSFGGNGAEPGNNATGGTGAEGGIVSVTNNANILLEQSATLDVSAQLRGIRAHSVGGDGGDENPSYVFGDQLGGPAGDGNQVTVTNAAGGTVTLGSESAPVFGNNLGRGIEAVSQGGTGGQDNGPGGAGGTVTLTNNGSVSVYYSELAAGNDGVSGLYARSDGGDGTASFDNDDDGGNGASAGTVTVTNSGSVRVDTSETANAIGGYQAGIFAESIAGNGGASSNKAAGGVGGAAGSVTAGNTGSIVTIGSGVAGVMARSVGGVGGNGNGDSDSTGGAGGTGGNIQVNLGGSVSTGGREAYGVIGQSVGGLGGGNAGTGGRGANGGTVGLFSNSGTVTTSGDLASGITLHSIGGGGGTGEDFTGVLAGSGGNGGNGGNAGKVEITSATGVTTSGDYATGLVAQSIGGSGGTGGIGAGLVLGLGGDGGGGGAAGNAIVNNTGNLVMTGYGSGAIVVQSISGGGGLAGMDGGALSIGGQAGSGSNGARAYATNNGDITTSGDASTGISVQSIGGGGGSAAGSAGIFVVGGSGSAGGNGGEAEAYHVGGQITTAGEFSHGISVQSIGGGGGSGGNVFDLSVANVGRGGVGGDGSVGGNGGSVCLTDVYDTSIGCSTAPSDSGSKAAQASSSGILTTGDFSVGAMAQSVGGGGGNGGSATGVDIASITNIQIGASGSAGGNGGTVRMAFNQLQLETRGNNAQGLISQSIGGGGGNGGNASNGGAVTLVPVQVGGSSGIGGDGGEVTTVLDGSFLVTRGASSAGVVSQSVGGGGGTGGSATGYNGSIGVSIDTAVGGTGGPGGDGQAASVVVSQTTIGTGFNFAPGEPMPDKSATDSHGIVAQAIGGGGGVGGTATADAVTLAAPTGEDVSFAVSISTAVGGSGGVGGNGAYVGVGLRGGSSVLTGGDGAIGILAQSVGGGGGDGGGASSLSDTIGDANTISLDISTSIGGDGGSGGNSDVVVIGLDEDTFVETFGDHANAVVAQSISGGGGNGGVGSASSNKIGGGFNASLDIGVGGSGGTSGSNDTVTVELASGSSIRTHGANAHGLVAQAITGGGGTSQGGNIGLSASAGVGGEGEGEGGTGGEEDETEISGSVNVSVGRTGGGSVTAGYVDLATGGMISTDGGDSDGIIAQSIGGSGGVGGSAGSDAGDEGDDGNGFLGGDDETSYALTASAGGTGGTGGDGGDIGLTHTGTVTTLGDWSDGIVLQSIGGGGGTAGTATAAGSGATATVDLAIGGTGGTGGSGGAITASFTGGSSAVSTKGHAAHGVLIQSIGGGGGHGADGSASANATIAVGGGLGGSGGASGLGGQITVTGDMLTVSTQGNDAFALAAQSIGGGGGTAGAGSSKTSDDDDSHSFELSVGGNGGGGGGGNTVSIDSGVTLATSGDRAFGILAQSIGGGGGVSGSADGASIKKLNINGTSGATGDGGAVSITLEQGSGITTAGRGAHAIVAQSIGGGGGIVGDTSRAFTNGAILINPGDGIGGAVTMDVNADITTTGNGAFGILAQSIGGGGGLAGDSNGVFAGSSASGTITGSGSGGAVSVTQSGTITASGAGSIGIYAQSTGYGESSQPISIQINGTVTGGTGDSSSATQTVGGTSANTLQVTADALVVAGTGGHAIRHEIRETGGASASSTLLVDNTGTIDGSISLHEANGPVLGLIRNHASGTLRGATQYAGHMTNAGIAQIGDKGANGTTRLTGNFSQEQSGTLQVGVDFVGARSDILSVEGDAALAGYLSVDPGTLAPNVELDVVTIAGTVTGDVVAAENPAVIYNVRRENNTIKVSATDTRFESAFAAINGNQRNVGAYMDTLFDTSSGTYGTLLADLDRLAQGDATGQAYARGLSVVSSGGSQAAVAAQTQLAQGRLGKVLSCPQFSGDASILKEQPCTWGTLGAAAVDQDGAPGYDGTVYGMAAGGQFEFHPDWFIGFAAGYENSSYDGDYGLSSVDGDTGFIAAALKRQWGALLLSGAVSGSYGTFETTRLIDLPSFNGVARGDMDVATISSRVRAAYTIGSQTAYVRPFVDLDVISTYASGYEESDAGVYNLKVASESQTAFIATPALEVGTHLEFSDSWEARGFVRGGVSISSEDEWTTSASLSEAFAGSGTFDSAIPIADVVGRVAAGAQLTHEAGFNLIAEYESAFGSGYSSHSGTLKFSYKF
jgi:hypothetical protein